MKPTRWNETLIDEIIELSPDDFFVNIEFVRCGFQGYGSKFCSCKFTHCEGDMRKHEFDDCDFFIP